jgi:hypothetical protein
MRIHERGGKQEHADRPLDEVEWEIIKGDLALLKHEAEARGDMNTWRKDQRRWGEGYWRLARGLRSFFGSDPAR